MIISKVVDMNIIVCTFTVLASFLVLHSHASTTIRIRQWNGQMRRLDVDIDSDNHRDVWQQILGASSSNSVVEIDGRRFNENDFLSAVASKGIVLKNGEIVNIIDPEKSMEKSEAANTPKQATPKTSTKKVKTLKDIELARKSLIRIKRQKSDSRKLVVYNDSERILERLNTKGGIALLLSLDKDGLVDQRSNAHFICELYSGDIVKCLKEESSLFSRSALYKKILSLAEAVKGTVVGCCISIGNDNSDFCDNNRHWSSFHILSALDIFSDFTFKSPFILR